MISCVSKVYGQFIIQKELSLDNLSKSWSEYQQDTKYNLTDFNRRYFKDTISLTEIKETFYKYKDIISKNVLRLLRRVHQLDCLIYTIKVPLQYHLGGTEVVLGVCIMGC